MGRIRKLIDLPPGERWLLLKAASLLLAVRLSLWLLPYPRVRPFIDRACRRSPRLAINPLPVERLVWAVEVVSPVVPDGAHCLSRALAAQILLMRRGYQAEIRYGVTKEDTERLIAHAWLEYQGRAIIGDHGLNRYVRLGPRTDSPSSEHIEHR